MSLTPSQAIADALNADPGVQLDVPGGVWWGIGDQSAAPPFAVLALMDGANANVCQGAQVGTLDLTYWLLTYAPLKSVAAADLQAAADAVHTAMVGLAVGQTFAGWTLRRGRWQRVIERAIPTEGEDRWQSVGGEYLMSFAPETTGESES